MRELEIMEDREIGLFRKDSLEVARAQAHKALARQTEENERFLNVPERYHIERDKIFSGKSSSKVISL